MLNEVESIRSRFPIFKKRVYLNSCSQGALCDAVAGGMTELASSWNEFGSPWDVWVERYEEMRREFARFIGAEPQEVAVVTSVSQGLNTIASALDFRERPAILMGEFEFPTMGHVWLAQRARGAEIQFLPAAGNRILAEAYVRAISKKTHLVPITSVCFMNGFRSELQPVVKAAHASGALVMLDDYQDCGTRPVDVKALDVDFYLAGTLKYLLGPSGLAFLYVRKELIPRLNPSTSGWFAQANPFSFDVKVLDRAPDARRFESGTPPIPSIYAAFPALKLLGETGMDRIAGHIAALTAVLLRGARELGLSIKTPADSVGPLTVLRCKDAGELVARLAAQGFVCSSRHDGLRISFHLYNTAADVEAVLQALKNNLDLLVRDERKGDSL
jgi:selenocysteine lyase/cysteine desulfurase